MSAETDPKKIAERLEQTKRARRECVPKSPEEASEQLLRHAWQACQITEAQYQTKLKAAIVFIQRQKAKGNSN